MEDVQVGDYCADVFPEGVRRLALADVDEAMLQQLAEHGEDLFVERKASIPSDGIGRSVAAFANTLGGWVLLGVADDRTLVGFTPPGRADPQSWVGQLLGAEVDPLPPYLADMRQIGDKPILVIRVFESADTPHLLRTTGSLVIRTTAGTQTVADQRLLLELARRGEEASAHAYATRIRSELMTRELWVPDHPLDMARSETSIAVVIRAALLTLPLHFSDWAVRQEAAEAAVAASTQLAGQLGIDILPIEPQPYGQGVLARWRGGQIYPIAEAVAIDAGGAVGAELRRDPLDSASQEDRLDRLTLGAIHLRHIRPLIETICQVFAAAEVTGRTLWRLDVQLPHNYRVDGTARSPRRFSTTATLTLSASEEEQQALGSRWGREYARESGQPEWQEE